MKICDDCFYENDDKCEYCIKCGKPLTKNSDNTSLLEVDRVTDEKFKRDNVESINQNNYDDKNIQNEACLENLNEKIKEDKFKSIFKFLKIFIPILMVLACSVFVYLRYMDKKVNEDKISFIDVPLYIKSNELNMVDSSNSITKISKNMDSKSLNLLGNEYNVLINFTKMVKETNYIYFSSRFSSKGFELSRAQVDKPIELKVIATDVLSYLVLNDDKVLILNSKKEVLIYKKDKLNKIDENVDYYHSSRDGKYIYLEKNTGIYFSKDGDSPQKISEEGIFFDISYDGKTAYFREKNKLVKFDVNSGKTVLSNNVIRVEKLNEDGSIFYVKKNNFNLDKDKLFKSKTNLKDISSFTMDALSDIYMINFRIEKINSNIGDLYLFKYGKESLIEKNVIPYENDSEYSDASYTNKLITNNEPSYYTSSYLGDKILSKKIQYTIKLSLVLRRIKIENYSYIESMNLKIILMKV